MPYPTTAEFAASSFLVYSCFETANRIGGSLLLDCALTETEAQEKKAMYEQRSADFYREFPAQRDGTSSIIYIKNMAHWWTSKPAELPSAPPLASEALS